MTVDEYIQYVNDRFKEIKSKSYNQWNVFQKAIRWI